MAKKKSWVRVRVTNNVSTRRPQVEGELRKTNVNFKVKAFQYSRKKKKNRNVYKDAGWRSADAKTVGGDAVVIPEALFQVPSGTVSINITSNEGKAQPQDSRLHAIRESGDRGKGSKDNPYDVWVTLVDKPRQHSKRG